jgi:tRNA nucleotidyltransferase (CCA-adding enzyme)
MKFYLTGGAVRDELLKLPIRDRDYIILDADKNKLLKLGYTPVGNDYEVYLHPETKDEYSVVVENDLVKELERRDLTINSIAYDLDTKEYIDPFGGIKDLESKTLRHTSSFFSDDPVRILRLARFRAQYADFKIADETKTLCIKLSQNQNLFKDIQGERFLLEFKKVLSLNNSNIFFELLKEFGTLKLFFEELSRLEGVPQRRDYHPEGDCWVHTMLVLEQASRLSDSFSIRFSSLVHDLGKGITPKEVLPSHIKHEINGVPLVKDVCKRFKLDSYTEKLALVVCKNHLLVHQVFELKPSTIHDLLVSFNALREGTLFADALICCMADARGRGKENENKEYPQKDFLLEVAENLRSINIDDLKEKYKGKKLGDMIREKRISIIKVFKNTRSQKVAKR